MESMRSRWGRVKTSKKGPNSVSGVVWAIGTCFFFLFLSYFINTNHYIIYYRYFKGKEGSDNENEPK